MRVAEGDSLTQTIKHRDEHGRLDVETRVTICGGGGVAVEHRCRFHIERFNGLLSPAGVLDA